MPTLTPQLVRSSEHADPVALALIVVCLVCLGALALAAIAIWPRRRDRG